MELSGRKGDIPSLKSAGGNSFCCDVAERAYKKGLAMGEFEVDKIIIPLYIDSAKTYLQLSIGALALSVVFREKILGERATKQIGIALLISWLFFLLAIGASALYQYLAIKHLDRASSFHGITGYLEYFVASPGKVYGMMLIFFFAGSVFLVVSSVRQLFGKQR